MATAPPLPPPPPKLKPVAVPALDAKLGKGPGKIGVLAFAVVLIIGVIYAGSSLASDLSGVHNTSILPYLLLGLALLVALGFEFVNGFHNTANAVATVIYTHSLEPHIAVVWSGLWNFLGVVTSSGLVAFGIISLLPVELILQVGSKAGFAMVFALLVAAIIWNLSTWYFGLPASSSHTLIGSIIGVGIANQLMSVRSGTSGVDWIACATSANDMYLVSEALRLMQKTHQPEIAASDWLVLSNYKKHIDNATKFIPLWVKVAVAMALGLGTMVGWKRIVVTVGEKIGKDHLTYGQGAAAEITAMVTIGAADWFGLPVSTTHVLSSGIAGTMAANHTGLQWGTVRNLLMAWVLTLPASMILAGFLFWGFTNIF
jgi:phosphate/sulfate permease